MRLLLIEDDRKLSALLARGLREEGFAVDATADGGDGAFRAVEQDYDAIILDVMLPGLDGFQVLEKMRAKGKRTPVLMLTARSALADRVRGLNSGAGLGLAIVKSLIEAHSGRIGVASELGKGSTFSCRFPD